MITKFLLAENPINEEEPVEYILHTEFPKLLAEVKEGKLGYDFEIVLTFDEISDDEWYDLKLEMLDWWNEYLDWEESLEDE